MKTQHGPSRRYSLKTAATRRERLMGLSYTPKQISRIRGPVGLPIGSKRTAEIALSILTEITATRNGIVETMSTKSEQQS